MEDLKTLEQLVEELKNVVGRLEVMTQNNLKAINIDLTSPEVVANNKDFIEKLKRKVMGNK